MRFQNDSNSFFSSQAGGDRFCAGHFYNRLWELKKKGKQGRTARKRTKNQPISLGAGPNLAPTW